MDEANMEADGGQQERQAKNEKLWKAYPPETYRNTIAELVHFSSKTVNSNAALAGVRLASGDALDAPYVSARTLMALGGVPFAGLRQGRRGGGGHLQTGECRGTGQSLCGSRIGRRTSRHRGRHDRSVLLGLQRRR